MTLIELRFLVEKGPLDEYQAMRMVYEFLSDNLCPEQYVRWGPFGEEEKHAAGI